MLNGELVMLIADRTTTIIPISFNCKDRITQTMDFPSSNPPQQSPNPPIPPVYKCNNFNNSNRLDQYPLDYQCSGERMEEREIDSGSGCDEVFGGMFWGERTASTGFMGPERTGWRGGLVSERSC
jgi:hypothetical protein